MSSLNPLKLLGVEQNYFFFFFTNCDILGCICRPPTPQPTTSSLGWLSPRSPNMDSNRSDSVKLTRLKTMP